MNQDQLDPLHPTPSGQETPRQNGSNQRPWSVAELRRLDRLALEELHLPVSVLMENAGRAAALAILERLNRTLSSETPPAAPSASESGPGVLVLCGSGNNGGDGFVIARYLANAGCRVQVIGSRELARLTGAAQLHAHCFQSCWPEAVRTEWAVEAKGKQPDDCGDSEGWDCVVDALLGTGLRVKPSSGEGQPGSNQAVLREPMQTWIQRANATPGLKVAIDVPTGMDADTGATAQVCFQADLTLTFVGIKWGFGAQTAKKFIGQVQVLELGLPRPWLSELREK